MSEALRNTCQLNGHTTTSDKYGPKAFFKVLPKYNFNLRKQFKFHHLKYANLHNHKRDASSIIILKGFKLNIFIHYTTYQRIYMSIFKTNIKTKFNTIIQVCK